MSNPGVKPNCVWFVGDGLNDAPCCRIVSEKGGISCAISSSDKSAFFTDISLDGSLDYIFKHSKLNRSLKQNIVQNKGILIYSTLAFLAFIISFSIVGIAVSPLIPMTIMLSTTLFILFNSYRAQLAIDNALDKSTSLPKKLVSSNLSIGLLLGASALFTCGVLVATISTGGLALPVIAFTAGVAAAFSSVCTLSAISLVSAFIMLLTASVLSDKNSTDKSNTNINQSKYTSSTLPMPDELVNEEKSYGSILSRPDNTCLRQSIDSRQLNGCSL